MGVKSPVAEYRLTKRSIHMSLSFRKHRRFHRERKTQRCRKICSFYTVCGRAESHGKSEQIKESPTRPVGSDYCHYLLLSSGSGEDTRTAHKNSKRVKGLRLLSHTPNCHALGEPVLNPIRSPRPALCSPWDESCGVQSLSNCVHGAPISDRNWPWLAALSWASIPSLLASSGVRVPCE